MAKETVQELVAAGAPAQLPDVFRQYPTLGRVAEELAPIGQKTKLREWVDRPILIQQVKFFKGEFGDGVWLVFVSETGELWNSITSAGIIMERLKLVQERLPLVAYIYLVEGGAFGQYYTIE